MLLNRLIKILANNNIAQNVSVLRQNYTVYMNHCNMDGSRPDRSACARVLDLNVSAIYLLLT